MNAPANPTIIADLARRNIVGPNKALVEPFLTALRQNPGFGHPATEISWQAFGPPIVAADFEVEIGLQNRLLTGTFKVVNAILSKIPSLSPLPQYYGASERHEVGPQAVRLRSSGACPNSEGARSVRLRAPKRTRHIGRLSRAEKCPPLPLPLRRRPGDIMTGASRRSSAG